MKGLLRFAALPLALAMPFAAQAADGFVVANTTLFAGPASEYPAITDLPYGTYVSVQGCTEGWEWCDVIVDDPYNDRGWVAGDYIAYEYEEQPVLLPQYAPRMGIPLVVFEINSYWPAHYRSRPFFRERDAWSRRPIARTAPPPPPPKPPGGWHVPPRPSGGGHHGHAPSPPHHANPPNPPQVPVNAPPHPHGDHHANVPTPPPMEAPRAPRLASPHPTPPRHSRPPLPPQPASSSGHGDHRRDKPSLKHDKKNDNNDNGH